MFGKRKAEDISEESGSKHSKIDKKERTEDIRPRRMTWLLSHVLLTGHVYLRFLT
jgi:hypothetical protein